MPERTAPAGNKACKETGVPEVAALHAQLHNLRARLHARNSAQQVTGVNGHGESTTGG